MAYQTFALKYRPQTFDEIIGQDHVATTLRHAVTEGRVAHGYLFSGPRGTGKTSTARVLAKALNCEEGPTATPCCQCSICTAIATGTALDLIEIDAASNRGIDDIRELRSRVGYAPTQARCKFYILDEAHMLTNEASNALLKTLEEPPEHVYFVLATTEPHNILPTIRSRCQSFELRPIPQAKIVGALQAIASNEGVEAEEAALGAIARAAGGAMRDAESIFDQVIAYGRGEVTLEVVNSILGVTGAELLAAVGDAIAAGDVEAVFRVVDEVVASGKDIGQLLEDLALYFRDILRISLGANPPEWMQTAAASREQMQRQAQMMGPRRIGSAIEELGEASARIRDTSQKPLLLEVTLAHLAAAQSGGALSAASTEQPAAQQQPPPPTASDPEQSAAGAETVQDEDRQHELAKPAEAAEPEPEPDSVAAAPPEFGDLQERWPAVAEALRDSGHASIIALLERATPSAVEGDTVVLEFDGEAGYECERVGETLAREVIAALSSVFGCPLKIDCRLQEVSSGEAEDASAPAPGDAAEDKQEEIVEALKLSFEGTEDTER